MMHPRQKILNVAKEVPNGNTKNIICPFCEEDYAQQGRPLTWKPNRSMSVSREDYTLLYNCFRSSCSRGSGVIHILDGLSRASLDNAEKKESVFVPNAYKYKTRLATVNDLPNEMTLTNEALKEQHVRYAIDRKTVAFPIFDSVGHEVGIVDRSYNGRDPKALTYWFHDVPKMHFPIEEEETSTCLLVEDIPSAIRATPFISSVALLGTNLTSECLMNLRNRYRVLYIALDEDATVKAINMAKQYTVFFNDVIALPLKKDIKNMTDEEIENLLEGI